MECWENLGIYYSFPSPREATEEYSIWFGFFLCYFNWFHHSTEMDFSSPQESINPYSCSAVIWIMVQACNDYQWYAWKVLERRISYFAIEMSNAHKCRGYTFLCCWRELSLIFDAFLHQKFYLHYNANLLQIIHWCFLDYVDWWW